ncbi:Uncharacterised protein [Serratia ficaria]|uniref:hypothetical protein n=1 Tax=Serratia ficaria TaxID=61651 RepID=UPI0021784078|nr:hypothetical protein [Serratia ficaria]CAI1710253.1 Uncharacterised protein [Serratia ficaria]
MPNGSREGGFSYLLLLAWLSVLALMMLRSEEHLHAQWRQEREAQLLFAGDQIRAAIDSYRKNPNGGACFPLDFQQLLSDSRGGRTEYRLRRLYRDPLTGRQEWGMIYDSQQRWVGVYSQGKGEPLKKNGFATRYDEHFKNAKSYADWQFKVEEDAGAPLPAQCRPPR